MKHQAIWKYIYIVLFLSFGIQNAVADKEKRNFTLVIDAGHGGHDGGAVGSFSKEKNISYWITKQTSASFYFKIAIG